MLFPNSTSGLRAGIALGSNLGNSLFQLRRAAVALLALSTSSKATYTSGIYQTVPVDCPPGSPHFLNAVVEIEWQASPMALWLELQRIESLAGRQRPHPFHAPRPLDLDLLYLGWYQGIYGPLILPHPKIGSRRFVLVPLSDVAPHLILPREKKTVLEQLLSLPVFPSVKRIEQSFCCKFT